MKFKPHCKTTHAPITNNNTTGFLCPMKRPPQLNSAQTMSDTLHVRGLSRRITDEVLINQILNQIEPPIEIDIEKRQSGLVWARYSSFEIAQRTIMKIHQSVWHGVSVHAKFEMGCDANGKRVVAKNSHNTVIRSINYRKGFTPAASETRDMQSIIQSAQHTASYTSKSLLLGNFEYPFPTGLYLSRVVQLTRKLASSDPLLLMITDPCLGNKFSKEISEIMAMVDATDRAVKLILGADPSTLSRVTVYTLGDGKRPLCAAALCLHMPSSWQYVSIDPLLEVDRTGLGEYSHRFCLFRGLSQDFSLDQMDTHKTSTAAQKEPNCSFPSSPSLSIVIALHSHAPLSEFWTRLGGHKIAVTMECCAEYSELHSVGESPVMEFDDFEVYSPKRRVKIYSSSSSSPQALTSTPFPTRTDRYEAHSLPSRINIGNDTNTKRKASAIDKEDDSDL